MPVNELVDLGHNPAKTIVAIAISVAFNDTNGGATATPRFIWQRTKRKGRKGEDAASKSRESL